MSVNKKSFLWWREARQVVDLLVPEYATKAEIHRDEEGYWLKVWWGCGIIAALTIQEYIQAKEGI